MIDQSDELLLARVIRRDPKAFELLYDRYARAVYVMAAHLLDKAMAEEIVQEVFLRLWNRAQQFDARQGSFKAWFMSIARHRVLDELRTRNKTRQDQALQVVEELLSDGGDGAEEIIENLWQQERGVALLRALRTVPEEQRRVIVLGYFGGMTQSQMAEYLRIPLGTVKKRVRLGLQKLRTALVESAAGSRLPHAEYEIAEKRK
ncbi:MAG: sigma-70 family RNA polymerase sigma factor [Chloroflexi bacterium]|nr:sigma-70 family RNA polymerase sigma factor [Chloroflexota bacterium]